jgi:hypothetical protein
MFGFICLRIGTGEDNPSGSIGAGKFLDKLRSALWGLLLLSFLPHSGRFNLRTSKMKFICVINKERFIGYQLQRLCWWRRREALAITWNSAGGTEKNHVNINQVSRFPRRGSKRMSSEYKPDYLPLPLPAQFCENQHLWYSDLTILKHAKCSKSDSVSNEHRSKPDPLRIELLFVILQSQLT